MMQENPKQKFDTVIHLTDIYPIEDDIHDNKYITLYENLKKRFFKVYEEDPQQKYQMNSTHFVRVPGSINLFSSQTSKLSFNIEQDIVIAFCQAKDSVVVNTNCSMIYPEFILAIDPSAKIMDEDTNIKLNELIRAFQFGYKSAFNLIQPLQGFKCMISINEMMQKLGYGFHNAISIGAALVGLHVNQMNYHKIQLLNSLTQLKEQLFQKQIKNEYSQMLNIKDYLMFNNEQLIDALRQQKWDSVYIQFQQNYKFIIAHSLTPEPKLITYSKRIAKRQVERELAIKLLRQKLNLTEANETILQLQNLLGYSDEDMISFIKANLKQKYFSQEIERELDDKIDRLINHIPYAEQLQIQGMSFNLAGQLIYNFKENIRIQQVVAILQSMSSEANKAQLIGKLMDEDFSDSKEYLEVEVKEINDLHDELKSKKALGVRIIGTDWGGALVALFPKEITDTVVNELQDTYYGDPKRQMMISDDLSLYVFSSAPSIGAVYLDPRYEIWF